MEIIYPPTLDWGWMRQRPQQLMRQFARHGHRVFYCNQNQRPAPMAEVEPNLFVVSDCSQFVRDVVPSLAAPLVWCSWPRLYDSLDQYRPGLVVFDCIDRFAEWEPYVVPMAQRADLIIASSDQLFAEMSGLGHPRVHLIRNGCDSAHFSGSGPTGAEPEDLAPYPRPRAGFVGAWAPWIDGPLLEAVAKRLPGWSFPMVGPYLGGPQPEAANIHLLGLKSYASLPAYLHHCDVAILPFRIDQTTVCADPIKVWEYLATGLPIVGTPVPEAVKAVPLIRIADTPERFAEELEQARSQDSPEQRAARQALAGSNSWESRFREILQVVPELLRS